MILIRIYHTLGGSYPIHNKEFRMGTVVLQLDNKVEIFCDKANFISQKNPILVLIYNPYKNKWYRTKMKNEYTEFMWKYYKKHQSKINPKIKRKVHYKHANQHGTRPVTIPKSVRWAAEHPYQGGGVSPR